MLGVDGTFVRLIQKLELFMRSTYITSIIIGVLVMVWLASGYLTKPDGLPLTTIAERNTNSAATQEEKAPTRVRVETIHATERERITVLRGTTLSKRSLVVRTQVGGIVTQRAVERGDLVKTGQLLCQISVEDRLVVLNESRESLNRARIEYKGSQHLSKQGLQSETAIAQARERLASAEAGLKRSELDVARLRVMAPFDAVVEDVHLEVGEYVTPGTNCATVVDLDPMLLVGRIPEKEVPRIRPGLVATATISSGAEVSGPVTFVGKTADESTRTYPVEIKIDNGNYRIPSGISASIRIPIELVQAQRISPALLSLDDRGQMGVKAVDADYIVHFYHVQIVSDDPAGIWVTGLPSVATVITVGQEMVMPGELVETIVETMVEPELPAIAVESDSDTKSS